MPLTDTKVRSARPKEQPYKLADAGGLFLLIKPDGGRYWRLKYRYAGKEKLLAVGVYPTVTLAVDAHPILTRGAHLKLTQVGVA